MAKTQTQGATTSSQDDALKKRKKEAKKEARLMLKVEQAKKDVQKAEQKIHKAQDNFKTSTDRLHDLEGALSKLQMSTASKPAKANKSNKASKNNKANKNNKAGKIAKGIKPGLAAQPVTPVVQAIDPGDSYQDTEEVEAFHLSSLEPVEGSYELTDATTTVDNQPASNQSNGYVSEAHHASTTSEEKHDSQPEQLEATATPSAEDVTIQSGEGSMPVETSNEHAWPPPLIREEVAEAIEEEAKKEPTVVENHTQPPASLSHEMMGEDKSSDHSDTSPRHPAAHRRHTYKSASHQSEEKDQEQSEEKPQDTQHSDF